MTDENTEPTRGEIVEAGDTDQRGQASHKVTPAPREGAAAPMTLFGTTNPREVIKSATETAEALTEILEEKQLYKDIRDRRHVLVEGWTLLGSLLGVFPVTIWTRQVEGPDGWTAPQFHEEERNLHSKWCKQGGKGHPQAGGCDTYKKTVQVIDSPGSGGWEARVEAHTLAGQIVGTAEAECRWDEWAWRDRDSHALRSMAQTRATAKALRLPLGFIVELAGFSATPAEEMPADGGDPSTEGSSEPQREHAPGHPVWDNTGDPEKMEKQWPAFKCKRPDCTQGKDGQPWATWDKHYFTDPEVRAKQKLLDLVAEHEQGWRNYYEPDAPDYTDAERDLIQTIHESGDTRQMAGFLWNRITTYAAGLVYEPADEGRPNQRDLNIIIQAAKIALEQAEDADAPDIILELDAVERAIDQIADAEDAAADASTDGYG